MGSVDLSSLILIKSNEIVWICLMTRGRVATYLHCTVFAAVHLELKPRLRC